ncbi:MAG: cyclic nucleotide-binding domain-containing protein [Geminicoccaceae bacterium]
MGAYCALAACGLITLLAFHGVALGHEQWVLTPEQMAEMDARPLPDLFTAWSIGNVLPILAFVAFLACWVWLGFTGARELFPDLQARLASHGDIVAPILRFCLAWMLLSSSLGAEPRVGVVPFSTPSLFAPDLLLHQLAPYWAWLRWAEIGIALALLLGIYVRFFAGLLLGLAVLGIGLFGTAILSYVGALAGACIYLVLQGAGRYFPPLPAAQSLRPLQAWLAAQPRQRAQAIMRVLAGSTVLYMGISYKVLHPNLMIGIIETYHLPILSSAPETFTLIMTLVEIAAGLLIIAGILLRPLAIVLMLAFLFFASLLPESYMAHALFYGVVISFFINGAGHWRAPEARDKAAEIVIVGGGFAAIGAGMRIERLVGPHTHVNVTLVHDTSNMLFYPLLPEVVGGLMQPGDVVNPIRRILPQCRIIGGRLDGVDSIARRVTIRRRQGSTLTIAYDQLILAPFLQPDLDLAPGAMAHACAIDSVGDALHIRVRIHNLIEDAELADDPAERARLLTIAVIGSGQRSCATAVEVAAMLRASAPSYPVLREQGWQVWLYEDTSEPYSDFEASIASRRDRELLKAGVRLGGSERVANITDRAVVLASGERRPAGLVINASFQQPVVQIDGREVRWPPGIDGNLGLLGHPDIWIPASGEPERARFLTTADLASLGRAAGYNAWARTQGHLPRRHRLRQRLLKPYNMGRRSLCGIGGLTISGTPAWLLSRFANLAELPGLERNVRILIDWLLDIPFRHDIAVLAPERTERLQRSHFAAGDAVITEGDVGETAYVVNSGRLAVLKDGVQVAELAEGDCFGEIALLSGVVRTATVRCLTACDLTVLVRDDFQALSAGRGALAAAIRRQADERRAELAGNDNEHGAAGPDGMPSQVA